jgi:tetratricopeptide (TPR) repeat protein
VPLGIDCERCHGPGSLHVTQKQQGTIVDTSTQTDYTIVNPRKLSIEQQNNLCQRCHLQGIAVLNDGSRFDDFLPSNELSKTMNIFMPTYSGSENHMIMASHVERMKMSNCFVTSGQMSCITCHNPHVSVKVTPKQQYIDACQGCHSAKDTCSESFALRDEKKQDCITCHMPKNGSIDIPHVAVTDHFIRRKPAVENADEIVAFIGMTCYNNNKVDDRTMARAYLEFYERYEPSKAFIDSAFLYVEKAGIDKEKSHDPEIIRAYYLLEAYDKVITLASTLKPAELKDAWTCYRIGESYLKTRQYLQSIPFLQRATSLKPFALDFLNKLGNAYIGAGRNEDAKKVFQQIINEHPKHTDAYASLGYLMMQEQRFNEAAAMLQRSIMLDPDQLQVLINLAVVYHQKGADVLVKPLLWKALALQPDNRQVQAMLADLK